MDLSIIIINWNSRDYVRECLRAIYSEAVPFSLEVIVFDSGSKDGCAEMVQQEFPQVRYYESDENLGFARANNTAVAHAHGDALFFLNPDTEVRPGALRSMYQVLVAHPNAGAVGARLLNSDGTLQTSCVQAFPTILNQVLVSDLLIRCFPRSNLWGRAALFNDRREPQEVEAVSGAAIMMRRTIFHDIGSFCEAFFMYSEDLDLCYTAFKRGFRNIYVPEAVITHHGGGSSKTRASHFATCAKLVALSGYFSRHYGQTYAWMYRPAVCISALTRLFFLFANLALPPFRRVENNERIRKWTYALRWAFRGQEPCNRGRIAE